MLARGGRLGVVSWLKTEQPGRIERLYEWFHDKLPAYVDCRPIEAEAMIQAGGFKVHDSHIKSMWGLQVQLVIANRS